MLKVLVRHPKTVTSALAAGFYFSLVSSYLQFGKDLSLAVGWLGLGGKEAVASPVWGEMIRFAMANLPGSVAFRLGVVSALCGTVSVLLFAFTVECFLTMASRAAEENAVVKELHYENPVRLGTLLSALAFLFTPAFFLSSTRVGPLMSQMMIALAGFAAVGLAIGTNRSLTRSYLITFAGFLAALAGCEGMPGVVAFPFLLLLVCKSSVRGSFRIATACGLFILGSVGGFLFAMGDGLSIRHVIRSISVLVHQLPFGLLFPGSIVLLVLSLLPVFVLYKLIVSKRMRTIAVRAVYFGVWAVATAVLVVVVFGLHPVERGKAADRFVDRVLEGLGSRTWLVSDGSFDDLLLLKKPESVHLVTLRREHDPRYGEELAKLAADVLHANDDLRFAAELGPTKFLDEWLAADAGATSNCFAMAFAEPRFASRTAIPCVFGWGWIQDGRQVKDLAKAWEGEWQSFASLLDRRGEPGVAILKRWFGVQGNAIGAMAASAKDQALAWKVQLKVVDEVDPRNFSALANLVGLLDAGYQPGAVEQTRIRSRFENRMNAIRSQEHLKWELSMGGRLFVNPDLRMKIGRWREELRKNVWETPNGKRFRAVLDGLTELGRLDGEARNAAIVKMENTTIPSLRASQCATWVKNLTLGEFYMRKGDAESILKARDLFRVVLEENVGEVHLAFDRVLDADLALRDMASVEYDALLVLRRDVRHQIANALLGSMRLEKREYESAERFLRRAMAVGPAQPGMRNDLALALSGQKRHEEAIRTIDAVVAEHPDQWNLWDSKAIILKAAGRTAEALKAREEAKRVARKNGEYGQYLQVQRATGGGL